MSILDLEEIPADINPNVKPAKQITMKTLLGNPRGSYNQKCRSVTNPKLTNLISYENVGPFNVKGLKPAIESLKEVLAEIKESEPEVFEAIGHAGMLCVRYVRGSSTAISNHSWGTAIDLMLDGHIDTRGDNKVQQGLIKIAPIFNKHGWFWGAGFRTEDAMHFEISDEKIRQWHSDGIFGDEIQDLPNPVLSIGDRGKEVEYLQEKLNEKGADIKVDGDFGSITHTEVMAFQGRNELQVDGIVGKKTWAALES